MVCNELIEGVELDDPEEVLAGIVTKDLEVLHLRTTAALHTKDRWIEQHNVDGQRK